MVKERKLMLGCLKNIAIVQHIPVSFCIVSNDLKLIAF